MGGVAAYADAARQLGDLLARQGITLVYGGSSVGLMGEMADAALAAGGVVVGVMPRRVFQREVAHRSLTRLIEVDSMHERKQMMYDLSDAFVGLPGGIGTLEELTEMVSWAQLGLHDKPIATVDLDGYWSHFHALLAHMVASGFMKAENLDLVLNVGSVDALLPALRDYAAPAVEKWIGLDDT